LTKKTPQALLEFFVGKGTCIEMRCQEDQLLCFASFFSVFYNSVLTANGWLLIEARNLARKLVRSNESETQVGDIICSRLSYAWG